MNTHTLFMKSIVLSTTLGLLLLCGLACRKTVTVTKTVEVNKQYSWQLDSLVFGLNKILLTGTTINDSTLIVSNGLSGLYVHPGQVKGNYITGFYTPNYLSAGLVPPVIDKHLMVQWADSSRLFMNVTDSGQVALFNWLTYPIPPASGYPNAIRGFPLGTLSNSGYAIVDSKYVLAPYEIDGLTQAKMSLVKVSPTPSWDNNRLNIDQVKDLVVNAAPGTFGFTNGGCYSRSFYHKFFVQLYNQFFRIDTLGNVKSFGYRPAPSTQGGPVSEMFTLGGYLFALCGDRFDVSTDQGETWNVFAPSGSYSNLHYFNASDNNVYASFNSQLFRVTLSGTTLSFQELDNDGLSYNQIMSVNQCGQYLFAVTASGLFYRDTATVNTAKK